MLVERLRCVVRRGAPEGFVLSFQNPDSLPELDQLHAFRARQAFRMAEIYVGSGDSKTPSIRTSDQLAVLVDLRLGVHVAVADQEHA